MTGIPVDVTTLADQRVAARAERDFALADDLRARIADRGYLVTDVPDGYTLTTKPPFDVHATVDALVASGADVPAAPLTVAVIVDGWPDDTGRCLGSVLQHSSSEVVVLALDCGNVDGAGEVLHGIATQHPTRVVDLHVPGSLDQVGWSTSVRALVELCGSPLVAIMDLSTVLDGDVLATLAHALDDPSVVAAGWRGVDVDLDDNWRSFVDAGPGEVDAVLGYLMVMRREAALATPPHPKARFYRNADMEWCLALRSAGGRIVVPPGHLPVHQDRHHGYHDTDPDYRDRESRRTYDRILKEYRGRLEVLHPRAQHPRS